MLVLHVDASGEWEKLYYGPFDVVQKASRYSARDNKRMIAIAKLKVLRAALQAEERALPKSWLTRCLAIRPAKIQPRRTDYRGLSTTRATVADIAKARAFLALASRTLT